jgi:hypothetical protein
VDTSSTKRHLRYYWYPLGTSASTTLNSILDAINDAPASYPVPTLETPEEVYAFWQLHVATTWFNPDPGMRHKHLALVNAVSLRGSCQKIVETNPFLKIVSHDHRRASAHPTGCDQLLSGSRGGRIHLPHLSSLFGPLLFHRLVLWPEQSSTNRQDGALKG